MKQATVARKSGGASKVHTVAAAHTAASDVAKSYDSQFTAFKAATIGLSTRERIARLRHGIEAVHIVSVSDYLKVPREVVAQIIGMAPATMHRKIKSQAMLSPSESERLERIAVIEAEAEHVFGNAEKAKTWLLRENMALGGTPLSMLDTEIGTGEVQRILGAIAYGGVV